MSVHKVNHNVIRPWNGTEGALTVSGGATPTKTSEWFDCNGWTDKRVSWEIDSGGTIDANITMHISPIGAYELNALVAAGTDTTDQYEAVTIVDAHTAAIMASIDAEDVDELQRPFRSVRFVIDNDQAAEAITGFTVWFEGWS